MHECRRRIRVDAELADNVVRILISKERGAGVHLLRDLLHCWTKILLGDFFLRTLHEQSFLEVIELEIDAEDLITSHGRVDAVDRLRRIAQAVPDQETLRKFLADDFTDRELAGEFLVVHRVHVLRNFKHVDQEAEGFLRDPIRKYILAFCRQYISSSRRSEMTNNQKDEQQEQIVNR